MSPVTDQPDDDFQPIRALNDLLFCPRRCALHRLEGIWIENVHTVEGSLAHRRAHGDGPDEEEATIGRVVRGLRLRSARLRLVGVADVVEFRPFPPAERPGAGCNDVVQFQPEPYPIEYKLGRRRRWDNDDVQLCAQALCLEEMLATEVPRGAVYHVRSRRRREVVFDADLRRDTEDAVARLHELIRSGRTPAPVLHPKCKACSLHAVCLPELISAPAAYARAANDLYRTDDEPAPLPRAHAGRRPSRPAPRPEET